MPPKPKPVAKGKAAVAAAKSSTAPPPLVPEREEKPPPSVADCETHLAQLPEEDWAELAAVEAPAETVERALESVLLLLGHEEASSWGQAKSVLADYQKLLRQLKALGPWGSSDSQIENASNVLQSTDVRQLERPGTAEAPTASVGSRAGAAKAKAPTGKAKATPKGKAAPVAPADPGASVALALGMLAQSIIASRKTDKPPPFPMVWPQIPFAKLHATLQQAMFNKQLACVLCDSLPSYDAAVLYSLKSGAIIVNIKILQVQLGLSKTVSLDAARADIGRLLREAMSAGRRCIFLLGDAPPNLRHLCDAKQLPIETFDGEKVQDVASALALGSAAPGFHVTLVVKASKESSSMLTRLVPGFDEMAVLLLDSGSLPPPDALNNASGPEKLPSLATALELLALQPPTPTGEESSTKPVVPDEPKSSDPDVVWNTEDFEYLEAFDETYTDRWSPGPSTVDENGKPIRAGLINAKITSYPADPKIMKKCLQLVGGALNAPCTGLWTSFSPLARPTEVEFEFTMSGKVDLSNACVVFSEKAFELSENSLPNAKVGLHFLVRGGLYLAGGGSAGIVKISNDGKVESNKWSKVFIRIDWNEKILVGQVDQRGRGYAPAMQTVPFRDPECQGFGFLYIFNTDITGTCWFSSLRIKQEQGAIEMDTQGLEARAWMAERLKKKEYDRAVAQDMEVGMKMGAISCTKEHGMNLAQEQAANFSSANGARM